MNYETAAGIEHAIAMYFGPRRNLIIPNVWWGMGLNHECDLLILTQAGYAYEIEIKVSKADLKRDQKKKHCHNEYNYQGWSNPRDILRRLYFAIPSKLENCIDLIPERAGILSVVKAGLVKKLREGELNPSASQLTSEQRLKLAELGSMRIWDLKRRLLEIAEYETPLPDFRDINAWPIL